MPKFRHRLSRQVGRFAILRAVPPFHRQDAEAVADAHAVDLNRLREGARRVDGVVKLKCDLRTFEVGAKRRRAFSATRPWDTGCGSPQEILSPVERLRRLSCPCLHGRKLGPRTRASFSARLPYRPPSRCPTARAMLRRQRRRRVALEVAAHRPHCPRCRSPSSPETWRRAGPMSRSRAGRTSQSASFLERSTR